MVEPTPGQDDLARLSEAGITDEALEAFFRGESKPWHLAATGWQAAEKSLWRRKLADAITVLAYPVPADWRCPECRCHGYARVDEQKSDGRFGPSRMIRCVECKRTYDLAAGTLSPLGSSAASVGEAVEALIKAAWSVDSRMNSDVAKAAGDQILLTPEFGITAGDVRLLLKAVRQVPAALARLHPAPAEDGEEAFAVPKGYRLVPVKPTRQMLHVMRYGTHDAQLIAIDQEPEPGVTPWPRFGEHTASLVYQAALSASPAPTAPKPEGQDQGATLVGHAGQQGTLAAQVSDQCRVVAHLAAALGRVHADYVKLSAIPAFHDILDQIGERSARIMEYLGDTLNEMDATSPDDDWTHPIFEAAQRHFPVERPSNAPEIATETADSGRPAAGSEESRQGGAL